MTLTVLAVKKYLTPLYDFLLVFDMNTTQPYGTTLMAQVQLKDTSVSGSDLPTCTTEYTAQG
jgi:hypothetical protein